MQVLSAVEVADDETQGKVFIRPQLLAQVEKLLDQAGMGETTMSPEAHHFIVGGLAYLQSAPISGMKLSEVRAILNKNKSAFKMLARSIGKADKTAQE